MPQAVSVEETDTFLGMGGSHVLHFYLENSADLPKRNYVMANPPVQITRARESCKPTLFL